MIANTDSPQYPKQPTWGVDPLKVVPATLPGFYTAWLDACGRKANRHAIVAVCLLNQINVYSTHAYPHAETLQQWGLASTIRTQGSAPAKTRVTSLALTESLIQSITQEHHTTLVLLGIDGQEVMRHQGWQWVPARIQNERGALVTARPETVHQVRSMWLPDYGVYVHIENEIEPDKVKQPEAHAEWERDQRLTKRTLRVGCDEAYEAIRLHYAARTPPVDISIRKPDVLCLPAPVLAGLLPAPKAARLGASCVPLAFKVSGTYGMELGS